MAIMRHASDSEERRAILVCVTCEVLTDGIQKGGTGFVCGWASHAREKLKRQDEAITAAILSSGNKPGDYDLDTHAGRVKYCVLVLGEIEKTISEPVDGTPGLVGKMAFVDTELRIMEPTYLDCCVA